MSDSDTPMLTMLTKVCTGCQQTFPATTEHFHRHPEGKYGLMWKCKACIRIANGTPNGRQPGWIRDRDKSYQQMLERKRAKGIE